MVLKSVGVLSCGKVLGGIYALMGLIGGLMFVMMAALGAPLDQQGILAALGVATVIVLPIINGIAGFIGGLILGLLYNLIAAIAGGIEMEFDVPQAAPPDYYSPATHQSP